MATARSGNGGVQSLQRAFELLERLADTGGEASLSELAASSGLPMPTIHRLIRTLVTLGYVRQNTNRRYALGARLIRLGENASLQFGTWARPLLAELVDEVGETYAGTGHRIDHARSHEWNHSLGEVVTAVVDHGLRVERLTEHDWTAYPRFPWLVEVGDGRWAVPPDRPRLPLSFSLAASRPA